MLGKKKVLESLGASRSFAVGKYLGGLDRPIPQMATCFVIADQFVFVGGGKVEIGRITKSSITGLHVEDKSQASSRITATRLLTLGVFALAAKKKTKTEDFVLIIDFIEDGIAQQAAFEYDGAMSSALANIALSNLKKEMKSGTE